MGVEEVSNANRFSRRTVLAAIDMYEARYTQAELTSFFFELGPMIYDRIRDDPVSRKHRLNDLKGFMDQNPGTLVDGTVLENLLVERATTFLPPEPEYEWSQEPSKTPAMQTFERSLELDGFTVTDGALRRILPADIALPETESELMRLMAHHGLTTAKGHLVQAMDAHSRGNWAGANGQIRTFLDALLDEITERIDPSIADIGTGHPRRSKLASLGFLSLPLNEWDNDGKGFINGLVKRLHPEGPHPGLSDEDDSTFRLNVVLLTATLLLKRYDRWPVSS